MIRDKYLRLCEKFQQLRELARIDMDLLSLSVDLKNIPDAKEELDKVHELVQALMNEPEVNVLLEDSFDEVLPEVIKKENQNLDSVQECDRENSVNDGSNFSQNHEITVKSLDQVLSELTYSFTEQEMIGAFGRLLEYTFNKVYGAPRNHMTFDTQQQEHLQTADISYYISNQLQQRKVVSEVLDSPPVIRENTVVDSKIPLTTNVKKMNIIEELQDNPNGNDVEEEEDQGNSNGFVDKTMASDPCGHAEMVTGPDDLVIKEQPKASIPVSGRELEQDIPRKHLRKKGPKQDMKSEHAYASIVKDKDISLQDDSFICDRCGRKLKNKRQLQRHRHHHMLRDKKETMNCKLCNKGFIRKSSLINHEKTHSSDKQYICRKCGKIFPYRYTLNEHLKTHSNSNESEPPKKKKQVKKDNEISHIEKGTKEIMKCSECGKEFTKKYLYQRHIQTHSSERPFLCNVCGKCFPLKGYLNRHMKLHSDSNPDLRLLCEVCCKPVTRGYMRKHMRIHTGEKPYKCSFCGKAFSGSDRRNFHERKMHTGNFPHQCSTCGKKFNFPFQLRDHERCYTGGRLFPCSNCDKTFVSKCLLDVHQKTCIDNVSGSSKKRSTGKYLKCVLCQKMFKGNCALAAHMLDHPDLRHCLLCELSFNSFQELQSHLTNAHLTKKHKCSKCGEDFYSMFKLQVHMAFHKNDDPFKCPECGKSCTSAQVLKLHRIFKHNVGCQVFRCEICGKSFKCRSNFRRHQLIHTNLKPYKCSLCGKDFGQNSSLQLHLWTHSIAKKYNCEFCDRGFNDKRAFLSHSKSHQIENVQVY